MVGTVTVKTHNAEQHSTIIEYGIHSSISEFNINQLISHVTNQANCLGELCVIFDCRGASLSLNELGKVRLMKHIALLFHAPIKSVFIFENLQTGKALSAIFQELNKKANLSCLYTDDCQKAYQWAYENSKMVRRA